MSDIPGNELFKKQNNKLIRSTFKKATISAINASSFTADVAFAENPANVIRSIPLAGQIDPTRVLVGDRCRVDIFDETNQRDMVVAYIYGRNMVKGGNVVFNSGVVNYGTPTTFPQYINHGIKVNGVDTTPDFWFAGDQFTIYYSGTGFDYIVNAITATSTQIQIDCNHGVAVPVGLGVYWFAVKFLNP